MGFRQLSSHILHLMTHLPEVCLEGMLMILLSYHILPRLRLLLLDLMMVSSSNGIGDDQPLNSLDANDTLEEQ